MRTAAINRVTVLAIAIVALTTANGVHAELVNVSYNQGASSGPGCADDSSCYTPHVTAITVGDTVRWTNNDTSVTSVFNGTLSDNDAGDLFNSGLFSPGESFEFTFTEIGEVPYFDAVHPWAQGSIIVQAVPEPTTLTALALGSVALLRRRR